MSIEDLYAYIQGESQAVEKMVQYPAGVELVYIMDKNRVRMAGDNIAIWDAVTGGVQLVEDTDYTLGHIDAELSTLEGRIIYGGYQIINVAYQGVNLYIDADIIGGYTTRPYRPTYTNITSDYTTAPSSVDDSIFADSEANPIAVTLADGTYVNQRFAVACTGVNNVTVSGTGLEATAYNNIAVQFIWNGTGWLQLGGAGGGGDSAGNLSIGMVAWFPGSGQIPHDKLDANGALVNILDYQGLYGKYGILYGGDGITTFGLPNLQGIFPGSYGVQGTHGDAGWNIGDLIEDSFEDHDHASAIHNHLTGVGNVHPQNSVFGNGSYGSTNIGTFASNNVASHDNFPWTQNTTPPNTGHRGDTETRPASIIGRWLIQAFDTVQEVPSDPGLIKDYNLVWEETPAISVPNTWGGGLFFIAYSYDYLGSEVLSNAFMGVAIDGSDREIVIDVDQAGGDSEVRGKYVFSTNSFDVIESGSDFANPAIRAIFKWGDVATGELDPPVDGWKTVWEGTPATVVPNSFGAGTYEIRVDGFSGTFNLSLNMNIEDTDIGNTNFVYTPAFSDGTDWVNVRYDSSTNEFKINATAGYSSGNITRIRKFNSLVNVVHTQANGIIQDEEINGQWVTRWAGGLMRIVIPPQDITSTASFTFATPFSVTPNPIGIVAINITPPSQPIMDNMSATSMRINTGTGTLVTMGATVEGRWK